MVLAAACGGPDGVSTDGGTSDSTVTADSGADAPNGGGGGLRFEFVTRPALPTVSADITVDEVRLVLRDVRAIGDSAPGDSRTSISELSLQWRQGEDPSALVFDLAPPGIYSNFEARLGRPSSGDNRFEIRGRVRVGSLTRPFRIENDETSARIGVDLAGLTVGAVPRTATLALSLAFLEAVPWQNLDPGEDEIQIEAEDPEMPQIVNGLASGFSLVSQ